MVGGILRTMRKGGREMLNGESKNINCPLNGLIGVKGYPEGVWKEEEP